MIKEKNDPVTMPIIKPADNASIINLFFQLEIDLL